MIHLRSVAIERLASDQANADGSDVGSANLPFALDIPAFRTLEQLRFDTPITLLVGENGSGKSTLLEALAWALELPAAGSAAIDLDSSLEHVAPLGRLLRPSWHKRTRRGFFLRAEDFFGYVKRTRRELFEAEREIARIDAENPELPAAERSRISGPHRHTAESIRSSYGADMDARSHGEQFLEFFRARLVPGGLYLLDEPEAPLSPSRQLALLSMLRGAVEDDDAQLVIATHSPILMAMPGATILSFDEAPVCAVAWEDLESVRLLRDFLARPESFLRHL